MALLILIPTFGGEQDESEELEDGDNPKGNTSNAAKYSSNATISHFVPNRLISPLSTQQKSSFLPVSVHNRSFQMSEREIQESLDTIDAFRSVFSE